MMITHDHRITVFPNDSFSRRYIALVKESAQNKGYPCKVKQTTMYVSAEWQEGYVHSDEGLSAEKKK